MLGDPLAALTVTAAIGLLGLAVTEPWLFPSLGPTVLVQIEYPEHRTARPYNTLVGHAAATVVAFAGVLLLGAQRLPPAADGLSLGRVGAASLGLGLTIAATRLLRASHPPAASTALLIALGGLPATLQTAITILAGVLLVVLVGGGIRELRQRASPLAGHDGDPRPGGDPGGESDAGVLPGDEAPG